MPNTMKRILFLLFLLLPGSLFAQHETLPAVDSIPVLTWKDRKEPVLAGFLSYLIPGAGQIYNKDYEKALGIVAVMAYSGVMAYQGSAVGNETTTFIAAFGYVGTYVYSFIDAIVSAKKINKAIQLQVARTMSLSLKPDFQFTRKPEMYGSSSLEPTLGLRLKLSL
jgi:hypothetical protein